MTEYVQFGGEDVPNRALFLTLDYERDFGTASPREQYEALEYTEQLVRLLEELGVSLTCFVQTRVLEQFPEKVERLRTSDIDVSFHPHSHTHRPREETDAEYEIEKSTERYRQFFGQRPVGYRFPDGAIRDEDYEHLAAAGYRFDASIFPSWRPGSFSNVTAPTMPTYLPTQDLVEIPFTVYSPSLRVPTALSYCRVVGRPLVELLKHYPPRPTVLNIHMHDLRTPPSVRNLPLVYRSLYRRNDNGFELLEEILKSFLERGYSTSLVDIYHRHLRDRIDSNESEPEGELKEGHEA